MNKIIFSLLAAALLVLVPITKSYALAKQYTEEEQEQLIKEYDELYDSWVSNGLSFEKIYENSMNWTYEKVLRLQAVYLLSTMIKNSDRHNKKNSMTNIKELSYARRLLRSR